MSEQSATRQELERSIRSLLPSRLSLKNTNPHQPPSEAIVGVAGFASGYCWGWIRGRRTRSKRTR